MNHFRVVVENLSLLGISPNEPRFNGKSVLVFLMFVIFMILLSLFLVLGTNTFTEYAFNIYILFALVALSVSYLLVLFKKEQLFKLIVAVENFLQKSKYSPLNVDCLTNSNLDDLNTSFHEVQLFFC